MFWWGRPNGGTVIIWRSVQITLSIYLLGLTLRSFAKAGCPQSACHFDIGGLLNQAGIEDTVPWLGAIFAAVWAALYARFSSQWTYLANVYNQIKQTLVTMDNLSELPKNDPDRAEQLRLWRAGFVEDALDLHLATKPMFATFVKRTLDDTAVATRFDQYTVNGRQTSRAAPKTVEKAARSVSANREAGVSAPQRPIARKRPRNKAPPALLRSGFETNRNRPLTCGYC
jgi:hypothetical protein